MGGTQGKNCAGGDVAWGWGKLAGLGPSARCRKGFKGVWSPNWGGVGKGERGRSLYKG